VLADSVWLIVWVLVLADSVGADSVSAGAG
jgi:hypothetical protein